MSTIACFSITAENVVKLYAATVVKDELPFLPWDMNMMFVYVIFVWTLSLMKSKYKCHVLYADVH